MWKDLSYSKALINTMENCPTIRGQINKVFEEHYYCNDNSNVYPNSFELVSEMGEGFPNEEDPILAHYYDIYDEDYNTEVAKQNEERKYEELRSFILKSMYMKEEKGE